MADYQRRLPHFHPGDAWLFLTWRLWGTVPANGNADAYPTPGHAFVAGDRVLDRRASGPLLAPGPSDCRSGLRYHFDRRLRKAFLSSLRLGSNAEPRAFADS